ncbi:MAG: matrixin family metalloprotease [Candidatus Rokuibacteriota bacterium]
MRGRLLLPLAAAALACDEPTIPARTAVYPFDLAGDVFHWPASHLPVRYFADSRGAMRALVQDGLATWEAPFLYGEFVGTLVADSAGADVIVLWRDSVPPDVPPDPGPPVSACSGLTTYQLDSTSTITGPLRVTLVISPGFTAPQVAACVRRVAVHELGHSIGLLAHSPNTQDVMASTPLVGQLSERDRETAEVLYHSAPTIGAPPRP